MRGYDPNTCAYNDEGPIKKVTIEVDEDVLDLLRDFLCMDIQDNYFDVKVGEASDRGPDGDTRRRAATQLGVDYGEEAGIAKSVAMFNKVVPGVVKGY